MNILELTEWLNRRLEIDKFAGKDPSLNGLQVECSGKPLKKAAFAVDACLETMKRAVSCNADVLIVHHGLFWGEPLALKGTHYKRIKTLFDSDTALYAAHIPLDANPETGHNACISKAIGLAEETLEPFGEWRGMTIGFKGRFRREETLDTILSKLFPGGENPAHILPFGPEKIKTAGVISGGAGGDLEQAIEAGLDLFITGEIGHEQYHEAMENGISVIAGGHYQTEVFGLKALAAELARETGLETFFIEVPTGL